MNINPQLRHGVLYLLVFLSGAAALVYEVVWQRYLAVLLGVQARATAIVVALFLGGLSAGYLYLGKWSQRQRPRTLLLGYVLIEAVLGIWGAAFPHFFRLAFPFTTQLYAALGLNNLFADVLLGGLFIGLPTFLMGGTLPLLTQALSKSKEGASEIHAKIYGFNTLGACLGCLATTFLLIPMLGMAWACRIAAALGLIVSSVTAVLYLLPTGKRRAVPIKTRPRAKSGPLTFHEKIILGVGFLSGFYLLALQNLFVRLMGLSLGASNYSFGVILSVFVLCLGLGALFARRIHTYRASTLFWNQAIVTLALFLLYLSGDYWSYGAHVLRALLRDLPENFYFYQGLSFATCVLVLIIPLGFCGLTMPICFHLLRDKRQNLGLKVGQLYAVNTVGCVLGALLGGYWLLNFLNLDQLIKVCVGMAALSAGLAAFLASRDQSLTPRSLAFAFSALIALSTATAFSPDYDKRRFIQPFRHPQPIASTFEGATAFGEYLARSTQLLTWRDGPNTTVGIGASRYEGTELSRTIFVNAKSDGNTRGDYFTTVMLAHIPALLSPSAEKACVIGFGTGMTIGTLAQYPRIQNIDVIEVSGTILENAHLFDNYNGAVSKNTKVHFQEMDAFRFFGGGDQKYGIIISEPSNPWVAGIENLYSDEFYAKARQRLDEEGVFVQWIHTYSFSDPLLKMVLATMGRHFPALTVFQLKGGDLALVGRGAPFTNSEIAKGAERFRETREVATSLTDAGIPGFETLLALEMIGPPAAAAMASSGEIQTLENPKLSDGAARAFFVASSSKVAALRRQYRDYYADLDHSLLQRFLAGKSLSWTTVESFRRSFCDLSSSKNATLCEETLAMAKILKPGYRPETSYDETVSTRDLASIDSFHHTRQGDFDSRDLQRLVDMFDTYKKYASPVAYFPLTQITRELDHCLAVIPSPSELFGECLLQKILVLDGATLQRADVTESIKKYLEWFSVLSNDVPAYKKLEEAAILLRKM